MQNKQQIRKVFKHCKSYIHCVRYGSNVDLNIFAIVNMMRITGAVISKKSKCAEQTTISKSLQTL